MGTSGMCSKHASRNMPRAQLRRPAARRHIRTSATSAGQDQPRLATSTGVLDTVGIALIRKLIGFQPLWRFMSSQARSLILGTAEEKGLNIASYEAQLKQNGVESAYEQLSNPDIQYPDYYLQPFHAYPNGNMSWGAAMEAKYSWLVIAYRTDKSDDAIDTPDDIQDSGLRWHRNIARTLQDYCDSQGMAVPRQVVDVGCSVGYSSRGLKENFPAMEITGIDASPYFIAVADTEERIRGANGGDRITYKHAVFEDSSIARESADMVIFQSVFHECTQAAIQKMLARAMSVLRPGGIVAFNDADVCAKELSELPAWVKVLRDSTEPHMAEFEAVEWPSMFQSAGFEAVKRHKTTCRHLAYYARKPIT